MNLEMHYKVEDYFEKQANKFSVKHCKEPPRSPEDVLVKLQKELRGIQVKGVITKLSELFRLVYFYKALSESAQQLLVQVVRELMGHCAAHVRSGQPEEWLIPVKSCVLLYYFLFSSIGVAPEEAMNNLSLLLERASGDLFALFEPRFYEFTLTVACKCLTKQTEEKGVQTLKLVLSYGTPELFESFLRAAHNLLISGKDPAVQPLPEVLKDHSQYARKFLRNFGRDLCKRESPLLPKNDINPARNSASLILKYSEVLPHVFIRSMDLVSKFIDHENITVRVASIEALGSLYKKVCREPDLFNEEPNRMDEWKVQLLSALLLRTKDKAANARLRAVKTLYSVHAERLVINVCLNKVVEVAAERSFDSSLNVRKQAVALLSALVIESTLFPIGEEIPPIARLRLKLDTLEAEPEEEEKEEEKVYRMTRIEFVKLCLVFAQHLDTATKHLKELLHSSNPEDIVKSINCLVLICQRGFLSPREVICEVLPLLVTTDTSVKESIVKACDDLLIQGSSHQAVIDGLLQLVANLSPAKLASLEDLFGILNEAKILKRPLCKKIWQRFKEVSDFPSACLLRMITNKHRFSLEQQSIELLDITIERELDWRTFRECLAIVEKLERPSNEDFCHQAIAKLMAMQGSGFFSVADQLTKTIRKAASHPLPLFNHLLRQVTEAVNANRTEVNLAKCLFVAGSVAMQYVIIADSLIAALEQKKVDAPHDELSEITGGAEAMYQAKKEELEQAQQEVAEQGPIAELLKSYAAPRLSSFNSIETEVLKKAVVIFIGKCMCISEHVCKQYIGQYLNLVSQTNTDEACRCTIIMFIGDLLTKHSNLLEQHVEVLAELLADPSTKVKVKAMMIISHLILNDMIKINKFNGPICKAIIDADLQPLVKAFFSKLGLKDADIVSKEFSNVINTLLNYDLSHEQFKQIASYLLKFVSKKGVGDTLIKRMAETASRLSVDSWAKVSFVMSQLPINESGLKSLLAHKASWVPRLHESEASQRYLQDFLRRLKSTLNTRNSPQLLEEFEAALSRNSEHLSEDRNRGGDVLG